MKELAAILFACVAVNHLGLVSAVENVFRVRLTIINCPKCLTFWVSLVWCAVHGASVVYMAAVPLALAYATLWLELAMGIIDTLYRYIYETIVSTDEHGKDTAGECDAGQAGTMPHLRKDREPS